MNVQPWEWEAIPSRFGPSGEQLRIGKIVVAKIGQPIRARGEMPTWRVELLLPGISLKAGTTDFELPNDAKRRAERAVRTWFAWLNESA